MTNVGGRGAVLTALESLLHVAAGHSVLLVGEEGVGKPAILRSVLRRLHAPDLWVRRPRPRGAER